MACFKKFLKRLEYSHPQEIKNKETKDQIKTNKQHSLTKKN